MTWTCPYLHNDGTCTLRESRECSPLERGCILQASGRYKRLSQEPEKTEKPDDPAAR